MALIARIIPRHAFDAALTAQLFRIYSRYYAPVDAEVFECDFQAKTYAVVLYDATDTPCGFSSVERLHHQTPTGPITLLFSGDTVIDRAHWGHQTLPFAWIEQAGRVKSAAPDTPLYWLLITKGHRTYRYLPAFTHRHYPDPTDTPLQIQDLIDSVAGAKFGPAYDAVRGILRPAADCPTALRPLFDGLDAATSQNRHVRFFLDKNPGHAQGEELVCLCELSRENLRPWARQHFERGLK